MTLRLESRCLEMIKYEMQRTCHPKAATSISASHKNPCREEINASKWKKKKTNTTSNIQSIESCWVAFLKFFLERVLKIIMPKSKFKLKYQYMFSQ